MLTPEEKKAILELERLQSEIYKLQQKRWGILFYRDHQANSMEAFAECDDEAAKLQKETIQPSEQFQKILEELQRNSPEVFAKWANAHIKICQKAQRVEEYKRREQLEHWQDIAAGKKRTPLNELSQAVELPNEAQELALLLGI